MKHAGPAALDALEPLLAAVRGVVGADRRLKERARGVFYFKSRAFLHFHEDPSGLWGDIRAPEATDFDRIRADSAAGRADILARVSMALRTG
jgi:hypothetical protein